MQLFIHFGLYKTGSSYLQTLCANSRSHLEKYGFFFPISNKDEDMLAGRITPGNGNGIASLIKRGNGKGVTQLIKGWCEQAQRKNCDKILISDEALIHAFANEKGLSCLSDSVKISKIESVSLFAFLRNPVDHCLSTYKHRAKRGGYPDFKDWVHNHYETPMVLTSFLKVFEKYPFKWMFAKYNRSEDVMAGYFFNDWLKINVPDISLKRSVNTSLTLSEIIFIQMSHLKDPKTAISLYEEFSEIKHSLKAQNNSIDNYYGTIASNCIIKFSYVFNQLNVLIFNNDKLEIPGKIIDVNDLDVNEIAYSKQQLDSMIASYIRSYRFSSILEFYKNRISTRIKRYIISKF